MSQGSAEISDNVTVLVFKDNYAARTFHIPLRWIARLGALLGILVGLSVASAFFAIKYYRIASKADLGRVQDLEQEIIDLRATAKTSETKSETVVNPPAPPTHTPVQPVATPLAKGDIPFFTNFSASVQTRLPDPSSLSFSVQTPKATWRAGKNLRVRFALQYSKSDQGSQEGKILVIARGPETLLSYPAGTLSRIGSEHLLLPEKGETFAVSRFREVKADFGPLRSQDALTEVEIYIFNNQGETLVYQKVPVEKTSTLNSSPRAVATPETSMGTPPLNDPTSTPTTPSNTQEPSSETLQDTPPQ